MRSKYLLLSVFLSVLVSSVGVFAQFYDDVADLFAGYVMVFGVIFIVLIFFNKFIDYKLKQLTGEKPKTSNIRLILLILFFLLSVISSVVTVPQGVFTIIGSFVFLMMVWTVFELAGVYFVKHSDSPERGIIRTLGGRHGRKEEKFIDKKEAVEKEEEETILEIFHFLKENPDVRHTITEAVAQLEGKEKIDVISELKDLYHEIKGREQSSETAEKLEAAVILFQTAAGETKAEAEAGDETAKELSDHLNKMLRVSQKVGKDRRQAIEAEEVNIKEEISIVHTIYEMMHGLIETTKEAAGKTTSEDDHEYYQDLVKKLIKFDKMIEKLAEELKLELSYEERVHKRIEQEFKRRDKRRRERDAAKKAKKEQQEQDEEYNEDYSRMGGLE